MPAWSQIGLRGVLVMTLTVARVDAQSAARFVDSGRRFSLELVACPQLDADEVRRIVAIELHQDAQDRVPILITVNCADTDGATAAIEVQNARSGGIIARSFDFSNQQLIARPRLFALAIAELAHGLEGGGEHAPPPAESASSQDLPNPPRDQKSGVAQTLSLCATARTFLPRLIAAGARLSYEMRTVHDFSLGVAVWGDHGRRATPLGRASFTTASTSAWVGMHTTVEGMRLHVHGGWTVGEAFLSAIPASADVIASPVRGLFTGPLVELGASVPMNRLVHLDALLTAGRLLVPVVGTVEADADIEISGSFLAASLGVGLAL